MEQFKPFYVGQEVEAVRDHSQMAYKKGQRFTIKAIRIECKCGWMVDIGISDPCYKGGPSGKCRTCGVSSQWSGEWLFHSCNFRAITPAMQAVTFEKITEQHPVSVN